MSKLCALYVCYDKENENMSRIQYDQWRNDLTKEDDDEEKKRSERAKRKQNYYNDDDLKIIKILEIRKKII